MFIFIYMENIQVMSECIIFCLFFEVQFLFFQHLIALQRKIHIHFTDSITMWGLNRMKIS